MCKNVFLERLAKERGCQKYPKTRIKVGAILYKVEAFSYVEGGSGTEVQEWVIRSIKRKRGSQTINGRKRLNADSDFNQRRAINCSQKIKGVTWGKLSKKNGDFGFYKTIKAKYKIQFMEGDYLPEGVFTTIKAAVKYCYKKHVKLLEESNKDLEELEQAKTSGIDYNPNNHEQEVEFNNDLKAEVKLLKSRLAKLNKK